MEIGFRYRLQAEVKGKTRLGRDVLFLIEDDFAARLDSKNETLATAAIVNADIDGDFTPETLTEMLEAKLEEYCLRYQVVKHSAEWTKFFIEADHPDVMVSFSNQTLTKQTTNIEDRIYAYQLHDATPPSPPENVEVSQRGGGITLLWTTSGHVHGTRIYDERGRLLASLAADAYEWSDPNGREPDTLYTYRLATYNANNESASVRVSARIPGATGEGDGVADDATDLRFSFVPEEGFMPDFEPGIGHGKDLQVKLHKDEDRMETFSFTTQLKGYTEESIQVYPRRLFRYKVQVHAQDGTELGSSPWRIGILDGAGDMTVDRSGKKDVRLNLKTEAPQLTEDTSYVIELEDASGSIEYFVETTGEDRYLVFSTLEDSTEEKKVQRTYYGEEEKHEKRLDVKAGEKRKIEATVPSPTHDPAFSGLSISEWTVVLNSDNPNVAVTQRPQNLDFRTDRKKLEIAVEARVLNPTQTAWHPVVEAGHYYLNQAEHYLFGESDVKKRILNLAELYATEFEYNIEFTHTKHGLDRSYVIRKTGLVATDGETHLLAETRVVDIIEAYLVEKGTATEEGDEISFKLVPEDPTRVQLHVGRKEDGELPGCMYAKTTEVIYREHQDARIFDLDENQSLLLEPAPLPGSPIIVKDATGKEMTQVFFYDELGKPTLNFEEVIYSNEFQELRLSYPDIDTDSLQVISLSQEEEEPGRDEVIMMRSFGDSANYFFHEGIVHLYPEYPPNTPYLVSYRIDRSFMAETMPEDAVRLTLHNATVHEENNVEVWYETKGERTLPLDANPLRSGLNSGFLYLSDKPQTAKELELSVTPQLMYAERNETTTLRLRLLDGKGNPVAGEKVAFQVSAGSVELLDETTGMDGIAAARYVAPDVETTVDVLVFAMDAAVEAHGTIEVKKATTPHRISLETSFPTIYPGLNEVEVTAYVYGKDQEPVEDALVEFTIPYADTTELNVVTDGFGQAKASFVAREIPRKGFIPITATVKNLSLKEETLVRILGFRDYHPDHFVDGNNLIDVYDRENARENLGIFAGSNIPDNGEANDLWLDQGDMLYLMQSYELRDVADKTAARGNLGVNVTAAEPKDLWPNDLWFEADEK